MRGAAKRCGYSTPSECIIVVILIGVVLITLAIVYPQRNQYGLEVPVQVSYRTDGPLRQITIVNKSDRALENLTCSIVNNAGKEDKLHTMTLPPYATLVLANYVKSPKKPRQDDLDWVLAKDFWEEVPLDDIGPNDSIEVAARMHWSKAVPVKDARQ